GRRPVFATLLVYDFQSQESCGLRHNTRKTQGFSTKNCDIQRRGFLTLNNHATYTRTVVMKPKQSQAEPKHYPSDLTRTQWKRLKRNTVQWKMGKIAASPCQTVSPLMVT